MKYHLVSGGCGFVGRNMVRRLFNTTQDTIIFIDNLLVGDHPSTWLDEPKNREIGGMEVFGEEERLLQDLNERIRALRQGPQGWIYFSTDSGKIMRIRPAT